MHSAIVGKEGAVRETVPPPRTPESADVGGSADAAEGFETETDCRPSGDAQDRSVPNGVRGPAGAE